MLTASVDPEKYLRLMYAANKMLPKVLAILTFKRHLITFWALRPRILGVKKQPITAATTGRLKTARAATEVLSTGTIIVS